MLPGTASSLQTPFSARRMSLHGPEHVLQRRPEGKTRWQQAAAVVKSAGNALSSVFTAGLALTTSLLMFIWFSNALTYYGEVLLTTTVCLCPSQHARSCLFFC